MNGLPQFSKLGFEKRQEKGLHSPETVPMILANFCPFLKFWQRSIFSHRNCITVFTFFEIHRSRVSDCYENDVLSFLQKVCNFSRNFFWAENIPIFSGRLVELCVSKYQSS